MQKELGQSMSCAHQPMLLQGKTHSNHQFLPFSVNKPLPVTLLFFRVKSQLKRIARPMYSNPPVHGARIVANVVGDATMFGEWKAEMEMMAGRIKTVRQELYDSLVSKDKSGKDWSFILKQIGMFSFTGLNKAQVCPEFDYLLRFIFLASFRLGGS